ncbi:hypothetical protein [Ottowia sp. VDI28]|uniref:hypothetical protein n=1 Tax=Ottowia sp. VDI28 TaxID=3133968 RepID=UPI003C2D8FF3
MIYTHVAAALLGAAIAATGAWQTQNWRLGGQIAALEAKHAADLAQAQKATRTAEKAVNAKYQGAINAARTREARLRSDIDHLNAVSDGLRSQAADAARRLADAPPPPSLSTPLPSTPYTTTAAEDMERWQQKLQATRLMSEPSARPGP